LENKELNNDKINKNSDVLNLNLKNYIFLGLKYWYLFLISFLIFYGKALYDIRYSNKIYSAQITLMIKDDKQKKNPLESSLPVMSSLSSYKTIQNEIEVIKSKEVIELALSKLDFGISYFVKGKIKSEELYPHSRSPFKVIPDTNTNLNFGQKIYIKALNDSIYELYKPIQTQNRFLKFYKFDEKLEKIAECEFEQPCECGLFKGTILLNSLSQLQDSEANYCFVINDKDELVRQYKNKIWVEHPNKNVSFYI